MGTLRQKKTVAMMIDKTTAVEIIVLTFRMRTKAANRATRRKRLRKSSVGTLRQKKTVAMMIDKTTAVEIIVLTFRMRTKAAEAVTVAEVKSKLHRITLKQHFTSTTVNTDVM